MVRSQIHIPFRLKLDESRAHIAAGASYTDTFEQTATDAAGSKTSSETDGWSVVSASESVTVPSGTYPDALHVRRIGNESGTKMKDYWYVRGIGKVKETGSDKQTEELVSTTSP